MPRTQRSSPPTTTPNASVTLVKSDSDIPSSVLNSPSGGVNIQPRLKRPCPAFSPGNEVQDLKHELFGMLSTWKKEIEERFTKFSTDQNSTLLKLVTELAELKQQNYAIQKSNAEIEKTVTYISKQYDDIIKDVDLLKKENLAQKDYISNLELKIQDIQQRSRTSSIEVRNVPPINNETAADLSTIIAKVGAAVGMPLDVAQLRDTYRLPGKEGTVRPIIAELSSVQIKNQLLSSVRNFNKSNPNEGRLNTTCIGLSDDRRPVYVAEYLPVSSRKLFYLAREFSKQKGYKYCWTSNGNIFIRKEPGAKQVLIRSEKTLKDLQSVTNQ
ncbi:hypothetical protein HW555_001154 [Spodoptera exigua]|uniref:FP protein C-terminal domain-containing protein n=1 Tax=Spodoptera exigua TaxID=7107 RepID=A0A835GTU3_SPOEX|nr:hypothetical protein HW555_001154 [Spodoptera exigua]